jgi:hypothetical protein
MKESVVVIIVDRFGHILDRDGTLHSTQSETEYFRREFADIETAKRYCYDIVGELPHVTAHIMDSVSSDQILFTWSDRSWHNAQGAACKKAYERGKLKDRLIFTLFVVFALAGALFFRYK